MCYAVSYPVAFKAVLVAKVDVVDVEGQTLRALQRPGRFLAARTFACDGLLFAGLWLRFSYGGTHRHGTSSRWLPLVCADGVELDELDQKAFLRLPR